CVNKLLGGIAEVAVYKDLLNKKVSSTLSTPQISVGGVAARDSIGNINNLSIWMGRISFPVMVD
ncbi:MAG: hypothetical protein RBR35_16560, partial [Salinivirgaceae bacterium]|nr:hypothetical protein [Salinivirgaceae bacterium]